MAASEFAAAPSVAVIGLGYWGRNHVRNHHDIGSLGMICDSNETTLRLFQEQYPEIRTCLALKDVLANDAIQGVVIATPAETHFHVAREALLAGKHVFVEKPPVLVEEQCAELTELADKQGLTFMVGHLLHYHPAFIKLKEMALNGELGRLNYIYSHRLNLGKIRREENILWSFAPHDISMILSLAGEMPTSVTALGGNYLHKTIADVTTTHLEFASGLKSHIFVSWLHPFKEQKLVVVGDHKMVVFDDTKDWGEKLLAYSHEITWKNNMPVPSRADPERFHFEESEPLRNQCEHFLECIRTGSRPLTDGREGHRVLQVLNACQRSLDNGCPGIPLEQGVLRGEKPAQEPHDTAFIHESSYIDDTVRIGPGSRIWHFSHILGNTSIGERCNIGQNVIVGPDVRVGNGCKIQNNVSIYKGVTLEDDVFCGPSMVFTNVINPRANVQRMEEAKPTLVRRGATLGANCTIVCGVTIGRFAFVGAGAVVTRDVPDHGLVVGNPARRTGWVCRCGVGLESDLRCPDCGLDYALTGEGTLVPGKDAASQVQSELAFTELGRQQQRIRPALERKLRGVLDHGQYIMGPEVRELERRLAGYLGVKHAITCSSGTDALLLGLLARGVGPGDAVLTTPFSFFATAEVVVLLGATPVFVDIDPRTFTMDPKELHRVLQALEHGHGSCPLPPNAGELTAKAILPVDVFGLQADYDAIMPLARQEGLFVLEDAAQSLGSRIRGHHVAAQAHAAATSFFPAKPLGCYGDGGAVFTNDDELATAMASLRIHGKGAHKYDNARIGLNARMDTLQAAVLLTKLDLFSQELDMRQRVADTYAAGLPETLTPQEVPHGFSSAWAQYCVTTSRRDALQTGLKEQGVPTAIYYPKPLHLQPALAFLGYKKSDFPASEQCCRSILGLPMHPYLEDGEIERVCRGARKALG